MRLLRPERQGNNDSLQSASKYRRQPWVVGLSRRELAYKIMRAKSKFTAFNTKQINVSSLNQETCNSLLQSRIFIHELLNRDCFLRFNNLKRIARGLGFKYIWHRGGRFLIKRRNGEKTQVFTSAADLHALAASYGGNVGANAVTTSDHAQYDCRSE